MSGYASAFESIQPDCFDKLASETIFAQIALFKIRHHDYASEINDALSASGGDATQAGTLPGVTIEVMMPSLAQTATGAYPLFRATQKFLVKENHTVCFDPATGLNLSAETVAQQILQTFHGFFAGAFSLSWYGGEDAVAYNDDFHPLVCYEATIHSTFSPGQLQTAPSCPITFAGGNCTITCPLGGAAVYYTVDGTFPGPGNLGTKRDGSNGTATLYSAPFAVASGAAVRSAAYFAGLNGSVIQQQTAP